MDNFSQLLAFSMAAYLQSRQWQEMWEQIRRKWWGIKQLIGAVGGWQRGETKCHRIRPKKSLWLKKSALKGFNVPCEVASLPEPWNPKSHFVRWWMNFQATKLLDKFVAMPLASCQTDTLWRGVWRGDRGGGILRRQILSASTSVYVKQIFSYSANGSETMTTWGQSAQSKDISVCFDAAGGLSGVLQSEKRGSL